MGRISTILIEILKRGYLQSSSELTERMADVRFEPGNCLSALGTVRTAVTFSRVMAAHLLVITEHIYYSQAAAALTVP